MRTKSKTPRNTPIPPSSLGETLSRLRKCGRISQAQLGAALGVHQTAVCRIEANEQGLTTEQLRRASDFFEISVDFLLRGIVNYWAVAKRYGTPPPFPPRYRELPHSTVRSIMPLLFFLNEEKGHTFTRNLFSKFEFDSILFADPGQPISVHFELDLLKYLLTENILTAQNFGALISHTRHRAIHSAFHPTYEASTESLGLVQAWVLNSSHYETNFFYEIESLDRRQIELSIRPREHMPTLEYKDGVMKDFLCRYRRAFISEFPMYNGKSPVLITETQCHFRGDHTHCIYSIKAA